jgi:hypothetical protein
VAHTRARTELHIITEKPGAKLGNYSKFLEGFPGREFFSTEGTESTENTEKAQRVTPCEPCEKPLRPLRLNNYNFLCNTKIIKPEAEFGIFVHNFLSSLTTFPQNENEIEAVTQNIEGKYKNDIANIFHKILNDKSLYPYFSSDVKVLNETSILFPNGNLVRPDRVVFLEDKVVIIDYKTGEPHASHKEQIDLYCEAVRAMGFENVEGNVLYI